jgi:cytochrome b561
MVLNAATARVVWPESPAANEEKCMQPVSVAATRYDAIIIAFHWAVAALVAIRWFGAQIIDWFPSGPSRIDARSVHIAGGVLLALILLALILLGRIVWRLTAGLRLPSVEGGIAGLIAKAAHCGRLCCKD